MENLFFLFTILENTKIFFSDLEGDARNIDEAIGVLSGGGQKVDRHPEKRMKAAFNEFEQKRYRELKAENPTLKRSQLKEILWREWQKSPDNPKNQQPS